MKDAFIAKEKATSPENALITEKEEDPTATTEEVVSDMTGEGTIDMTVKDMTGKLLIIQTR